LAIWSFFTRTETADKSFNFLALIAKKEERARTFLTLTVDLKFSEVRYLEIKSDVLASISLIFPSSFSS
jgi:hypothetical protein